MSYWKSIPLISALLRNPRLIYLTCFLIETGAYTMFGSCCYWSKSSLVKSRISLIRFIRRLQFVSAGFMYSSVKILGMPLKATVARLRRTVMELSGVLRS